MIPGEYLCDGADLELNAGRAAVTVSVTNTGDRPVQVGSHFHFFEVNRALIFDRARAYGTRLDIPSGTAVRFEPGDVKEVRLIPLDGQRVVYGFNQLVMGPLDDAVTQKQSLEQLAAAGFGNAPTTPPRGEGGQTIAGGVCRALRADGRRPHPPGRHRTHHRDRKRLHRSR